MVPQSDFYDIPEMEITPLPVQDPIPFYVASFSETSLDMAARKGLNVIWAPFAAGMVYGGMDKAAEAYKAKCEQNGQEPARKMCSYFIYIGGEPEQRNYGRRAPRSPTSRNAVCRPSRRRRKTCRRPCNIS